MDTRFDVVYSDLNQTLIQEQRMGRITKKSYYALNSLLNEIISGEEECAFDRGEETRCEYIQND